MSLDVIGEAAFWVMIGCAATAVVSMLVAWWRRTETTIETWRRDASKPQWVPGSNLDLAVEVLAHDKAALITVRGRLKIEAAQSVIDCMSRLTSEGRDHLVIDLSAATLDSDEGAELILDSARELSGRGRALGVVVPGNDTHAQKSIIASGRTRAYTDLLQAVDELLVS